MHKYTNSDLEKLLGERGHIIRYWEKCFPLIQPQKDGSGRFFYSMRDIQFFLRIKHLVNVKNYSIEEAREILLAEISGERQSLKGEIEALRAELLNIYFLNRSRI